MKKDLLINTIIISIACVLNVIFYNIKEDITKEEMIISYGVILILGIYINIYDYILYIVKLNEQKDENNIT